ncbi:unnamed protein product, partial [Rotaria sp. Silwood1]
MDKDPRNFDILLLNGSFSRLWDRENSVAINQNVLIRTVVYWTLV